MRLPSIVALGISLIAATSLADDGAIQAALAPETIRQVDAVFTKYDRDNEPGCSVGIVRDGELIYRQGFGLANMEHNSPMSSNTLVEIGSMSKSFTAVCVAMLLDSGKVLADDDIRQYIPELHPLDPPIRIRHLIECKSGLWEHYHIMPLAGWVNLPVPSPFSREDALGIICGQKRLPFEPGTQFKYGSFDYFLLGEVVRRVTGQPLHEFARERIFKPCGMSQTLCEANPGEIVAHRATCHLRERNGTWQQWRNAAYVVGGSGTLTSVDDLHQWERNFLKNQLPAGPHLEELLNNGTLFGNRRVLDVNPRTEYRGIKRFEFTGGVFGSATAMLRFPDEKLAIIVLANRDDIAPWTLAERVADILLADKLQSEIGAAVVRPDFNEPAFSLSKQLLRELTGAFRLPNDGPIWQTAIENESLVLMDHLEEKHALQSVSEKRFRVLNSDDFDDSSRFTFERTAPTEPWTITNSWWTNSGEKSQQLIPVRLAQPSESELAAFAGTYVSDELPVSYRIEARASVLWLQVGPRGWEQLEPTVENEFIPSVRTAHDQRRFRFQRDESNRVTGFSVSFWRIQDLRFHRQPSP